MPDFLPECMAKVAKIHGFFNNPENKRAKSCIGAGVTFASVFSAVESFVQLTGIAVGGLSGAGTCLTAAGAGALAAGVAACVCHCAPCCCNKGTEETQPLIPSGLTMQK